jgi:hypothetical protein
VNGEIFAIQTKVKTELLLSKKIAAMNQYRRFKSFAFFFTFS